jgi:FkbM family methyltransferase
MGPATEAFGRYRASLWQRVVLGITRIPPLYRGSFRPTWVRLLNWIRPGPVDVASLYGLFRVYPTTNLVDSAILLHPNYNREEINFLKAGMSRDGTFVDIGANIGLYSVALGNHLSGGGRVVSIEPNAICCERLRFNLALNGLDRVSVFDVAVGDFFGRGKLRILKNDLAIAQTVRDDAGGDFEVRPLEAVLEQAGIQRIDALKIDVEGFEKAVLEPFFRSAPSARWPGRICMEHLGEKADILTILRNCDYRLVKNTRNNSLLVREIPSK